jgi:T-complex protein 1 subunit beta
MAKVAELEAAERSKMADKVASICATGANVFVNRQLIYNHPESLFADAGVMAVEHADFEGVERLALVTGAAVASSFGGGGGAGAGPGPTLGTAALVEEVMIGEDVALHFSGVARGDACTIVLRGASSHVLDEAERSLHDALCVLSQTVADARVVWGGGWPEVRMAHAVAVAAAKTPGKAALAMEAFATALRAIPATICENAGMDAADCVARLRAAHAGAAEAAGGAGGSCVAPRDACRAGVDVIAGGVGDMESLGVFESYKVRKREAGGRERGAMGERETKEISGRRFEERRGPLSSLCPLSLTLPLLLFSPVRSSARSCCLRRRRRR